MYIPLHIFYALCAPSTPSLLVSVAEEFEALARAVGFRVVTCRMVEKACENRKLQKKMRRVWLHAVVEVPLSQ